MKKHLTVLCISALLVSCSSSEKSDLVNQAKTAAAEQVDISKYSIDAKKLVSDLGSSGPSGLSATSKQNFGIVKKENGEFVSTVLKVNDQIKEEDLTSKGVEIQSKTGNIWSAMCPLDKFHELSLVNGVENIDVAKKGNPK